MLQLSKLIINFQHYSYLCATMALKCYGKTNPNFGDDKIGHTMVIV